MGEGAARWGPADLLPAGSAGSSGSGSGGGGSGGGGMGRLEKAEARCRNGLYHDYLRARAAAASGSAPSPSWVPDLIMAYNAGIWGYDSWIPTLEYLRDWLERPTPVVITAYTVQECEDDAEVMEGALRRWHVGGGGGGRNASDGDDRGGDGKGENEGEGRAGDEAGDEAGNDADRERDSGGGNEEDGEEEQILRSRQLWPPSPTRSGPANGGR